MTYLEKGTDLVVGISGGKDSLAVSLHFIEKEYPHKLVFANTGWEHPKTYEYLEYLEKKLGKIDRVSTFIDVKEEHAQFVSNIEQQLGFISPFIRLTIKNMCLPNGYQKFCTPKLKIEPICEYLNKIEDPINVAGIRHEEGKKRSSMLEWEWFDSFDCWTWRPILKWTFEDIRAIHQRHSIMPNPLYLNGHNRVGCYPCIYANKADLRHLDNQRISIIKQLEEYISEYRNKKITMFKIANIVEATEWANTSKGGKQLFLFDIEPPSCRKWGICSKDK